MVKTPAGRGHDGPDAATHKLDARDIVDEPLWLLVVCAGVAEVHPLPMAGAVTIGRADRSDIVLADPSISRAHARLEVGRVIRVRDLGSQNGVRVGRRTLGPDDVVEVAPGEAIRLGNVTLVVQRGGTPDAVVGATPVARPQGDRGPGGAAVIVLDPSMVELYRLVDLVAPQEISVLLLGETGAGKEVVAEAIHRRSRRANGPFLRLNCASLSATLLESELFGYEKGAFTGAVRSKQGLLEAAAEGTVFLDELGEMPLELQAKLLRVIEDRRVLPVGSLAARAIDVRFIAATHRDLPDAVARGAFREDLYYRLNGIALSIPPLRERVAEIEPLARMFIARACERSGAPPSPIAPAALERMRAYRWPGNVRELRNAIDRAVVLSAGREIQPSHLPLEVASTAARVTEPPPSRASTPGALRDALSAIERERIVDALARCSGNQTRAARMLGISRNTLLARLEAYGLPRPRKGSEPE